VSARFPTAPGRFVFTRRLLWPTASAVSETRVPGCSYVRRARISRFAAHPLVGKFAEQQTRVVGLCCGSSPSIRLGAIAVLAAVCRFQRVNHSLVGEPLTCVEVFTWMFNSECRPASDLLTMRTSVQTR
jgi:hypothetical protein